jgi:hypothetical protein
MTESQARFEKIEDAVDIALTGLAERGLNNDMAFNTLVFAARSKVPDATTDEVMGALESARDKRNFENWIAGQIEEICQRHNALEDCILEQFDVVPD